MDLRGFWNEYVDIILYRVTSSEYLEDIKTKGLDPAKDPYAAIAKKIQKLFALVVELEDEGIVHEQDWGFKTVTGKYIVRVSSEDLNSPYIDFTPDQDAVDFYMGLNGGAMVQSVRRITEDLLKRRPDDLLLELNSWARRKSSFDNVTLSVMGSSNCLESALFQNRLGIEGADKYWESPFGSYEHFRNVVKNKSLDRYRPYQKKKKKCFVRVTEPVPPEQIRFP